LSKADNVASLVEPPTQQELNHAITTNIGNLMLVVKAVNKFKRLLGKKHPDRIRSLFDDEDRSGKPTGLGKVAEEDDQEVSRLGRTKSRREGHFDCVGRSKSTKERLPTPADAASVTVVDGTIRATGGQQPVAADERNGIAEIPSRQASGGVVGALGEKGHAHDVVDFQAPWLGIGVGHSNDEDELTLVDRSADIIIAESPSAAEFNIYDTAYREEVERIRKLQGDDRRVYLTRRIEHEHEPSGIPVPPTSSEWRS
jgi:[calcium/calmodulin-dependent protein kinase] kinase